MMNEATRPTRLPDPPDVVLLHASAVCIDGQALIFTGRSGAGKSTICRLLSGFGEALADDMVYLVRQRENGWIVADARARASQGPLSPSEVAAMKGPSLRAVFEIHQAPQAQIQGLGAIETCYRLTHAYFDLHYWACHYDTSVKRTSFAHLATIARAVPGYDLFFDRSHQIAQSLKTDLAF